jgi:pimeloyl-ACP methyl ester carboxylesterase
VGEWSWSAPAPTGVRVDAPDVGAPVYRATGRDGTLHQLSSQVFGLPGDLLAGPSVVEGDVDIAWAPESFGLSARCTSTAGGRVVIRLAAVDRVFDDTDLTAPPPVTGSTLLSLHRWDLVLDTPALTPDDTAPLRVDARRVVALRASTPATLAGDGVWTVPVPAGESVYLGITVRWPIVSEPDTYPTHDGGRQWWRTVSTPDVGPDPAPLLVGLHGAANTADNWLVFSNPSWVSSWKVVLTMLLGGVAIVPNANDAASVEPNPPAPPRPTFYAAEQERYVFDAIDEAARRFPVDARRVYVAGTSMGGHGALALAAHHPDRFAAAIAAVPPTDLRMIYAHYAADDPGHGVCVELAAGLGGTLDEVPMAYAQHSAVCVAENLAEIPVSARGCAQDDLVDGVAHIGALEAALAPLDGPHVTSVTAIGSHVDHDTIEGCFEQALPLLLRRPSVPESPDRVRYTTADLHWPGAHWVRITELAGEGFGRVDARLDRATNRVRLELRGIAGIEIDLTRAGLAPGATFDVDADCPATVTTKDPAS